MSVVDHVHVERLFQEALTHDTHAERHRFLSKACGHDAGLWNAVWDLLRGHFSKLGPALATAGATSPGQDGEKPGDILGNCQLSQISGEGPLTTVWVAEQHVPTHQTVAVKVINTGANEFLTRHEALRPALALLDHPAIVRLHANGMTKSGKPFLITELAAGVPITQFCDQQKVPLSVRLKLFLELCAVIHHAHQKGVPHGDLKPSNVLVSWDSNGQPRLRVTDFCFGQAAAHTVVAADGRPRTPPAYLAPEQVGTGRAEARGDVLALGVLLHELVTSRLPYTLQTPHLRHVDELRKAVQESAPAKPSECLSLLPKAQLTAIALARRTSPERLLKIAEIYIDPVVMRAMQKHPESRTASVLTMVESLQPCLTVVEAEDAPPPAMGTAAGTIIERYGSPLIAGIGILAVIVAVLSLIGWLMIRKEEADKKAKVVKHESESPALSVRFFEEMFASLTPERLKGQDTTLLKGMLDETAEKVGNLEGHPETAARMQETLGLTYLAMSQTAPAQKQLHAALENRTEALGAEHPDTLRSMRELATVYKAQGHYIEAESLLRSTLGIQQRVLGKEHPDTFITITVLAAVCEAEEQPMTSEQLFKQLWQVQKKVLGPDHLETLDTMGNLAALMTRQGRTQEALHLEKERLSRTEKKLGSSHPRTLAAMNIVASAYEAQGEPSEAEKMYAAAMEVMKQALGSEHAATLRQSDQLAAFKRRQGAPLEALKLHQQSLEHRRRRLGSEHPDTLLSMREMAHDLDVAGKKSATESLEQEVLDILRNTQGPEQAETLLQQEHLAETYLAHGRAAEAVGLHQQVLQVRRHLLGDGHPETRKSLTLNARALDAVGRKDEAEKLLATGLDQAKRALGAGDPDTMAHMQSLAEAQMSHGKYGAADVTWNELLSVQMQALGTTHPDTQRTRQCLAQAFMSQGRTQDAERLLREALEIERARSPQDARLLADASALLGRHYLLNRQATQAEPLLRAYLEHQLKHAPNDWARFCAESLLGGALLMLNQHSEAGTLLQSGYAGLQLRVAQMPSEQRFHLRDALERMTRYVETTQGAAAATEWKRKLAEFDQSTPLAVRY